MALIITGLWLLAAVTGAVFVQGLALGIAISTTWHAFLGSWAAVWRHGGGAWATLTVQVIVTL